MVSARRHRLQQSACRHLNNADGLLSYTSSLDQNFGLQHCRHLRSRRRLSSSTTGSALMSPASTAATRNSHGTDAITFRCGRASPGADTYHATKSEWLGLGNGYVDLGTWWCMTPFIGAGVGALGSRSTTSPTLYRRYLSAGALPGLAFATARQSGISPGRSMLVLPTRSTPALQSSSAIAISILGDGN